MRIFRSKLLPLAIPPVLFLLCAATDADAQVAIKIGQNFSGTDNSSTLATPPDPNGAIGPRNFVEFINGTFAVYNKTNGVRVQKQTDLHFWANAGVTISADSAISDPRIIYDPTVQRWFASQIDFDATAADPTFEANNFLIAVSAGPDPTGPWHGYSFTADPDNGYFADFPTLGVDSNAVYLSGEMVQGEDEPDIGPSLVVFSKADLLAATPIFTNREWFGVMTIAERGAVIQPAICLDGSGAGNLLAVGDLGLDFELHSNLMASVVLNGGSTNATLAPAVSIPVDDYTTPVDPIQPDGSDTLADNDARFSAKVYTVGGVLYAVHNTEVNDRAAIRWYRINAANNTLLESGTITDPDLDLFFPSIAANTNGTVVICCNGCSINTYISCYAYAGATVNGVTTFGSPILLQAGENSYHDFSEDFGLSDESRWGDYSATSVDPNDPNRFWTIQMYPAGTEPVLDSDIWSTQITELITAPLKLTITTAGTNAVISWPVLAADYQLQSTTNLVAPVVWSNVTQTTQTNSTEAYVLLPLTESQQFFRLKNP